jgi:hypothetical protein
MTSFRSIRRPEAARVRPLRHRVPPNPSYRKVSAPTTPNDRSCRLVPRLRESRFRSSRPSDTFGRESDRVGVRRRTRAQGQPEENKFENPWETTGNDDSDMLSRCDIHLAQETARHHIPTPKPTLGLVRAAHCALVGDNPPHLARTVARGHDLCASSVHPRTKGRSPRGRRRRGGHTCREPIRGVRVRIGREAASRRAVGRFRCRPPQHQVVARPG